MDVFLDLPKGSGFCLGQVFKDHPDPPDDVMKIRKRIGHGICLYYDDANKRIWLYNRMKDDIFVSSPSMEKSETMVTAYRVSSKYLVEIFDYAKTK